MKVTFNWLKQYVDFNWSPEELTGRLTMLGLEVEGVQKISGAFDGIVVAQILTREPVPGSDKLSVCKVNDGNGERTIICGAQNHKPGDKVPLILPDFALPLKPGDKEPFVIKERKVFGITSQGMMCSPQELGLPDQVDGLLILPADAPIGKPFGEYLGRSGGDVVYDLEVTPNRPDLNSVIGIAREIAAVTGNPLRVPEVSSVGQRCSAASPDAQQRVPTNELVSVSIEDSELCPRYTARVIKGVKVGPSPDWLKSILEKVGIRSISNVVDVTNYVMLESGHPLHAFDYHLISGSSGREFAQNKLESTHVGCYTPTIVVRRAVANEKFKTLDNQERNLTGEMLLIADEQKGIALAGVMGGANTEINNDTRDVLIESAYFLPTNIRRTSRQIGLRSESSYRFERGADIGICDWASRRAAQLILETAGGQLAEGVVDVRPQAKEQKGITLHFAKTKDLLGVGISHSDQVSFLTKLGLAVTEQTPGVCTFKIPSWRVDLKREVDLIEEVGRLYGVEKIPATPPRGAIGANAFDSVYDQIADVRRILTGLGLDEAQSQTLVDDYGAGRTVVDEFGIQPTTIPAPSEAKALVKLSNPMNSDMNTLRPSLLVGLIDAIAHNHAHKNSSVALFEIGKTFRNEAKLIEQRFLAIVLSGLRYAPFWAGEDRNAKFDSFDLKGIVEEFFDQFGIRGVVYKQLGSPHDLYLECAEVSIGGKLILGRIGQIHPRHFSFFKVRDHIFVAEFNLDLLLARRNPAKSFKPLPQFPSIRRDVAMLVPEATTHESVLQTVRQAKPANLESVDLFDVFRGKNVPEGRKSLAYAFTYRSPEKTLTDAEVNAAHTKIVEALKQNLGATVRE
jgi:phenylalanyl-tRNA synthetase beta chain